MVNKERCSDPRLVSFEHNSLVCSDALVTDAASKFVGGACDAGVLRFLSRQVIGVPHFEDDTPAQRELYSCTLNRLIMGFLDAPVGR